MDKRFILLVEDHPDDQFLTLRTLKRYNYCNVAVANEGEEALYMLRDAMTDSSSDRKLPGFILLDLRMPKLDGFEFLEIVKSDCATRDIPVIVLTSSPQERDLDRCLNLGATAYLHKPLEMNALNNALRLIGTA